MAESTAFLNIFDPLGQSKPLHSCSTLAFCVSFANLFFNCARFKRTHPIDFSIPILSVARWYVRQISTFGFRFISGVRGFEVHWPNAGNIIQDRLLWTIIFRFARRFCNLVFSYCFREIGNWRKHEKAGKSIVDLRASIHPTKVTPEPEKPVQKTRRSIPRCFSMSRSNKWN